MKENYIQKDNEDRKTFLARIAIDYIEEHTGFMGINDDINYDGISSDGYCLVEDLRVEFNIHEDRNES